MGFIGWYGRQVKKFDWSDMMLIKWSSFFAALLIAKLWMPLLSLDWYWYALVFVITAIKPLAKVFGSK